MRVFVATRLGQGDRKNDFFHGVEGELVRMPANPCADGRCGCDRSVSGFGSSRASTTFISVDRLELDPESYRESFLDTIERQGWARGEGEDALVDEIIDWHIAAAHHYPRDTVLRVHVGSDGLSHVESATGCACTISHENA